MNSSIELFALFDYIKLIIRYKEYRYFELQPFKGILDSYTNEIAVSNVKSAISNNDYLEALNYMYSYEKAHSYLHKVYAAIKNDFFSLEDPHSEKDAMDLLQDKYGILQCEQIIALLELQIQLIQEHQLP